MCVSVCLRTPCKKILSFIQHLSIDETFEKRCNQCDQNKRKAIRKEKRKDWHAIDSRCASDSLAFSSSFSFFYLLFTIDFVHEQSPISMIVVSSVLRVQVALLWGVFLFTVLLDDDDAAAAV